MKDELTQLPQLIGIDGDIYSGEIDQTVLAVNMKDLKELRHLLKRLKDQTPESSQNIPLSFKKNYPSLHRDDPLYKAKDVHEQAKILQDRGQDQSQSQSQKPSATQSSSSGNTGKRARK